MKHIFKSFFLAIVLLSSFFAEASHILGAEISFETPTNNVNLVQVNLKLYRDPSGATLGTTQYVSIENITNGPLSASCTLDYIEYVQISCSDSVEIYHYSSQVVFLGNSPYPYYFSWDVCCRAPGIDNVYQLPAPSGSGIFVEAVMISGLTNEPAQYFGPQILSYTTDTLVEIDISSFSPVGDSVFTELVPIKEKVAGGSISNVGLNSAFTYEFPFDTTRVTILDGQTGILSVQNPPLGTYALAVKTSTFNVNGVLLTSIYRDVTIFILPNNGVTVQADSELTNPTANKLIDNSSNGNYEFGVYLNDTLKFDFKIKPVSNTANQSVFAKVLMRGLWAESSQGGLCTTNNCAKLVSNSGLLKAADSLTVQFVFSPNAYFLNGQDSASQYFNLEYAIVDSCGVGVSKSEKVKVTVYGPRHSSSFDSYVICEKESVVCVISGDNDSISWEPAVGVINTVDSLYALSPMVTTNYQVYNLVDSTYIFVYVEVDTLITPLPLSVVNDTMVLPAGYQPYTSWSYINGLHTYINPDYTPIDILGKYWIKVIGANGCTSYSDTLYNMDPNVAVSSARCNGEISNNQSTRRVTFNFKPVLNNTILKSFRIMFDKKNLFLNSDWKYDLYEVGNSTPIAAADMVTNGFFMEVDSVGVNLENTKTYQFKFTPKTINTADRWLKFKPPSLPFTDENNLIEYVSGTMVVPVFHDVIPFIEMEVKQPNIGIEEIGELQAKVYPNPFSENISVEISDQGHYLLLDALGREVYSGTFQGNFNLETQGLSKGLYVLQLNAKDKTTSLKLIK